MYLKEYKRVFLRHKLSESNMTAVCGSLCLMLTSLTQKRIPTVINVFQTFFKDIGLYIQMTDRQTDR